MIDFKDKDAQVPSLLIVMAIAIFIGSLAYQYLVPMPKPPGAVARQKGHETSERATEQAKLSAAKATATAEAKVFRGSPEDVMARLLAQLTTRAQKGQVLITAFRPQKTDVLTGLNELPVSLQVTGEYPALIAFLNGIEQSDSKVAVRSFLVASTGDATSTVAATIGISVYSPLSDGEPATDKAAKAANKTAERPATTPAASTGPATATARGGSNG